MHKAHARDAPRTARGPDLGDDALTRLRTTSRAAEIERLADELTADPRALAPGRRTDLVDVLVMRLCDESARDDPDAEDAICSGLTRLGVMQQVGNLVFHFRPDDELTPHDAATVARFRDWLPQRYAPSHRVAGSGGGRMTERTARSRR